MHANSLNLLNLKPRILKFPHKPRQRRTRISPRENILVHEQPPDQIFILPGASETSDLQEEDPVVGEHRVHLVEERAEMTHADVFGHFETRYLVVPAGAGGEWDVAIVHAQDLTLAFLDAGFSERVVAPCRLVPAQSDASGVGAVVHTCVFC